jgi:hypothetical protein
MDKIRSLTTQLWPARGPLTALASTLLFAWVTLLGLSRVTALAQQNPAGPGPVPPTQGGPPGPGRGPQQPMSFFITSVGKGNGGDLGGLTGADAHCQALATSAGRGGVTWRAYLSTQGASAINARDRIGNGPWQNQRGQVIAQSVSALHGDTLEQARIGNFIGATHSLDEQGKTVGQSEHDILTGSMLDGRAFNDNDRDYTCSNWTSSAHVEVAPGRVPDPPPTNTPSARVGHSDKGNFVPSWNSSHSTAGCSQKNVVQTGGAGRFYCFAVN